MDAAPLLEEERCVLSDALVADHLYPSGLHRSGFGSGFAPGNHPVDVVEIQIVDWTYERFQGEEPGLSRDGAQGIDAVDVVVVLDRCSHPEVGRPLEGA